MTNLFKTLICILITAALAPAAHATEYFNEDWTWRYYPNYTKNDNVSFSFDTKFNGTVLIDDVEWHIFKTVKSQYHVHYFEEDHYGEVSGPLENGFALLIREDDHKWYVRIPDENSGLKIPKLNWENSDEIIFCDFNAEEGDIIHILDSAGEKWESKVSSKSSIKIEGEERTLMTLILNPYYSDFFSNVDTEYGEYMLERTIIEGLGYIDDGYFPWWYAWIDTGQHNYWGPLDDCFPCGSESFGRIINSKGETIFDYTNIRQDGIKSINDSDSNSDAIENDFFLYDLYGQRVDNPQPGSVYIRNGKKFIAR